MAHTLFVANELFLLAEKNEIPRASFYDINGKIYAAYLGNVTGALEICAAFDPEQYSIYGAGDLVQVIGQTNWLDLTYLILQKNGNSHLAKEHLDSVP